MPNIAYFFQHVRKPFAIVFHHGGRFVPDGKFEKYIGGKWSQASGLDPDRFGYLDLVEELKKLGIERWSRLSFEKPWSVYQVHIKDDVEVMQMISLLSQVRTKICNVYVVDGAKAQQEPIVEENFVGGGSSVLESIGRQAMQHSVIESVKKSLVSTYQSITKKKETTVKKGKMTAVQKSSEKTVDKSVQKSVQKRLFESVQNLGSASVNKNPRASVTPSLSESVGEGAGEGMGEGASEGISEGKADDGIGRGSTGQEMGEGVASEGMGAGSARHEGATIEEIGKGLGADKEQVDASDDDESHIPSCEEDETDDDMDDDELASGDEEYTQGRRK